MSTLNELIEQIENPELRKRIAEEANKLAKQKKFGLVFEEHLPECTPLYDIPVKKGALVMVRGSDIKELYYVRSIADGQAECVKKDGSETKTVAVDSLVTVAQFGEPIYPYLKPIDSICNAPDSDLWHTLIEADNYHALQLLEYLYAGKVDCIYIDPPYNKEDSEDWKYNCNYVDGTDQYRHSKWLSMIEKRLRLAKKLLNPIDSVMIVTIDETEYLHLGCLLEEMFSEARIQMISSVINPTGSKRADEFSRTNEFIYYVRLGNCNIEPLNVLQTVSQGAEVPWKPLRRSNLGNTRDKTKTQFYPIYINIATSKIVKIGEPIDKNTPIETVPSLEGCETVWPIRDNGLELMWGMVISELKDRLSKGYIKIGAHTPDKPQKYVISYLTSGTIEDIETNVATTTGYDENGVIKAFYKNGKTALPTTQWDESSHDAKVYGTLLLQQILPDRVFPFPKSLYAVHDCLKYIVANKPNALIIDFFAGSGTTLHAVNLLNEGDSGHRRCILVTNNEMKKNEEEENFARGLQRGSDEWNSLGIARYATWPRTVCSIKGCDSLGNPLKGCYGVEREEFTKCEEWIGRGYYKKTSIQVYPQMAGRKMSDGFKANANFFKLGFLDKTRVSLGMQFAEMLPTLWMKAGAHGECPYLDGKTIPEMLILPKNKMAVLNDENCFAQFAEELEKHPEIESVFIVTDYEASFVSMTNDLNGKTTYQLYRDYLDNFRINAGRNAR